MEGKYDVNDISRYIVEWCNCNKKSISNLKLQKLLYYVQGTYLARSKNSECLFSDDFVAWTYGPVVKKAYEEFRYNGGSSIRNTNIISIDKDENGKFVITEIPFEKEKINICDRDIIDKVLKYFTKYSAYQLVEQTHKQAPWKNAIKRGKNTIITKDDLYDFFKRINQNG